MAIRELNTSFLRQQSQFTDVIEVFLETKAENTRFSYRAIWREWEQYLTSVWRSNPHNEVRTLDAFGFVQQQRKRPGQCARLEPGLKSQVCLSTVVRKVIVLTSIYKFLQASKLIASNPFEEVLGQIRKWKTEDSGKRPTEIVPFSEVSKLIDAPDAKTKKGKRDRAFFALLFGGGLRLMETLDLTLANVARTPEGTYYVRLERTKAQKIQDQVLPDWVGARLDALITTRKAEGALSSYPLLTSYEGDACKPSNSPLNCRTARRIFKRWCANLGLEGHLSPHSGRATAITKLLNDGLSYREVQEFSRHSSVRMVELYDKRHFSKDKSPSKKLKY